MLLSSDFSHNCPAAKQMHFLDGTASMPRHTSFNKWRQGTLLVLAEKQIASGKYKSIEKK